DAAQRVDPRRPRHAGAGAAERRAGHTAGQRRCLTAPVPAGRVRIGHTVPVADRRRRSLRLRTRVTLFFSLTALVASLALAVVTYGVARSFLVDQRSQVILTQAVSNATSVRATLLQIPAPPEGQVGDLVKSLK